MAATWVYNSPPPVTTGTCFLISEPASGTAVAALKVIPLDQIAGSSQGQTLPSGSYVVWRGSTSAMLGQDAGQLTGTSVQECKDECDGSAACVLVYFESSTCYLRRGFDAAGVRTFVHVAGERIDTYNGSPWA